MMTLEEFNKIPAGTVFAKGEISNSANGLHMTRGTEGMRLKWIAKKGWGNDWCIYCRYYIYNYWEVEMSGDKVTMDHHVRRVVPCDNEVLNLYRY